MGKGIYLSKNYHLLRIKGGLNLSQTKFPTFIPEEAEYKINSNEYNFSVGLEPKKFFLDEIVIKAILNNQSSLLDNKKINTNSNKYIYTFLKKEVNNFEFKLIVGQALQKNQDFKFKTPILNLDTSFKISNKLSLFLKSKYIFHLFNFPNTEFTNLNTFSDGNLIYSNYNKN